MNLFYSYAHFLVAITSFIVALIVFFNGKKVRLNQILSLNSFVFGLWAFFYAIWMLEDSDAEKALFWSRMLNIWPIFIPAFLLHWILLFLNKAKKRKFIIYFYYLLGLFVAPFSFSNYFISGVAPVGGFPFWPQIEWLYSIFLIISWVPVFSYVFYLLFVKMKNSVAVERTQALYIFIGVIFAASGGSVNFLLMFGIDIIPPIFSVLSIAFPILFSYVVVRHRLFDIKLVLRRSTVYIFSVVFLTSLVMVATYLTDIFLVNGDIIYIADTIILVAAMIFFDSVKSFFYRLANQYFFTSLYNIQEVLEEVAVILRENIDKKEIYQLVMQALDKAFHFNNFGFLIFEKRNKKYVVDFTSGFKIAKGTKFDPVKMIERDFIKDAEPIITEELKKIYEDCFQNKNCELSKFIKLLEKNKVAVLAPLNNKGKTEGILVLGNKETNDSYNTEDIRLLKNISAQLAVALENARLYERLKQFNRQLERRVKLRTNQLNIANKKLTETNKKLLVLDKAKTEFLSIASHQLRTPLSSTKGFLSLLLDGTYGKIPSKSRQALEKICISNERLITLVEDLLNISRIEAGRLTFDFRKESLEKVTQEVLDTMTLVAKNAGLTLEKKFPAKSSPLIYFDRAKMREVISNFIDNAIKYTKEGQVTVIIEESKTKIRLIVQDTGMGIGKDDLEGIFEKFQRGDRGGRVNRNGVGLGLYVCRKIIDAHKGRVWAESDGIGKGSRFIIELDKNWKPKKVGA